MTPLRALGVLLVAIRLAAQGAVPEFEAAALKAIAANDNDRPRMTGGPGTVDPGRISYRRVTLSALLAKAYGLATVQTSGRFGSNSCSRFQNNSIAEFSKSLQGMIWITEGTPMEQIRLLDRTGLTGQFNFTLTVALVPFGFANNTANDPDAAPPLEIALEQQLGLKLEKIKEPLTRSSSTRPTEYQPTTETLIPFRAIRKIFGKYLRVVYLSVLA